MKKLILLAAFLNLVLNCFSQTFQWAKTQGDAESLKAQITIASDGANLISAGTYILPITFGNETFSNTGGAAYLVKHDPSGNLIWARHLQGAKSIGKVVTDLNQNIIVSGTYMDYLTIDKAIFSDYNISGASQFRNFIAKFNSNGALLWAQKLPYTSDISSVTTDGSGNIYYGNFYEAPVTIGSTNLTLPAASLQDLFIVKYDPAGIMQWVKACGGQESKYVFTIIGSNTAGFYLGCYAQGPASRIFLRKYSGNGTQVWDKAIINNDINSGFAFSLDQAENLYLIGSNSDAGKPTLLTFGNISLNLNGTYNGSGRTDEIFLAKLNASGNWLWAKKIATGNYYSYYLEALPKVTNSLFFTGNYSGNVTFGKTQLTSQTNRENYFNIKLDTAGNPLRVSQIGASSHLFIDELATDNQDNLFLAGSFSGKTLMGYNALTNNKPMTQVGVSTLGFLAKELNNPNTVAGTIFIDANGNRIKDIGEKPFENVMVENAGFEYTNTDSAGHYSFFTSSGTFNIRLKQPNIHYTFSPQNHSVSFTGLGQTQTKDFALVPIPNHNDVKITVTNFTPARPGSTLKYRITYQNVGTTTLSDSITLKYDSANLTYNTANTTPALQQTGKLQWYYQALQPAEQRNIDVNFVLDSLALVNTRLKTIAIIKPLNIDLVQNNNYDTLNQVVTAAFDPNYKEVNKLVISPEGGFLTYTIHFQNTGTDTAFAVSITDKLSDKLDLETLEMLSSSHPYQLKLSPGRTLTWSFPHILLPDSNHSEPASHGFVKFRIKTTPGLALTDSVANDAAIFFDYNAPVQTNFAITKISTLKTPFGFSGNELLSLFPNPAAAKVNIQVNLPEAGGGTLKLINLLGQQLQTIVLPAEKRNKLELPLNNLAKGVYLVQLQTAQGTVTKRLLVQ